LNYKPKYLIFQK